MKPWHKLLVAGLAGIALAVALALSALVGRASLAAGDPIYVDAGATGENDGSSWQNAFRSLQEGLNEALPGGEVWVATGVYTPTQESSPGDPRFATFQLESNVAIYGGFAGGEMNRDDRDWVAHPTTLSGEIGNPEEASDNVYHVLVGGGVTETAVLDGFTVRGGYADGTAPNDRGGGMYNEASSPTLAHVTFLSNWAGHGGGMYNLDSSPVLTHCTFADNSADYGGGMRNWTSSPVLTDCTFSNNSATLYGGGIYNYFSSSPTLTDCTFSGNSADYGGGICNLDSAPVLANCTFSGNSASYGGGMANYSSSPPVLTNCTFWGNSAESGGGLLNASTSPTLTNSILWGDTPEAILNEDEESTPFVSNSDIQGGCEAASGTLCGAGNLAEDPRFVDPDNNDFHLGPGTPCLDAGDNDAEYLPPFDFEGDDRILDGDGDGTARVDMGVDEAFFYHVYLPLIAREP